MTAERSSASSLTAVQMNQRLLKWGVSEILHGQLWPVALALTLIIASVFALTALAGRMEQIIVQQSGEALTADLVFESANPLPSSLKQLTRNKQYQFSDLTQFQTMAFNDNDQMQLVTVKAIDSAYPLKGTMTLQAGDTLRHHVKPNELWLDKRLLALLNVKQGDTLSIGDADFTISGTVQSEPGLRFNPFQQMPAVYIHQRDVAKTGALQLGSRVKFERYINASPEALTRLKQAVTLSPSDEWKDRDRGNRTIRVFERTEQYLSLTVAIVILMAATTLVLTCQHYVASRQRTIAMLKSLGATRGWILQWLVLQSSVLFVIAALVGIGIGVGLEFLLRVPLAGMLPTPLPSYGWTPVISALVTCLVIAIPALGIPFSYLLSVSPASAMNAAQTQTVGKHRAWWLLALPIATLIAVYYNNALVWMILAGILGLFVFLAVISLLLTRVIKPFALSPAMKLAVSRIERSKWASGIQFGALGLSLMLLAVIWLIRTDLLGDWQRLVPQGSANAFALNIAPYEKDDYLKRLDNAGIERSPAYPVTRGRLTKINDDSAKERVHGRQGANALRRELNLTWDSTLPDYNPVVAGKWTTSQGVSVEEGLANDLDIHVGDWLTFVINSQTIRAQVNSIRHVEWRQMKPNFYFIFTPDLMQSMPATWLVSFRVTQNDDNLLVTLSRKHPTVSILDIRQIADKLDALLKQIVWSVTILAGLGVTAGVLLIFTLLRLSLSQRRIEIQLYRTLGASRRTVMKTLWAEYGLMAFIAGIIASGVSELVVWGVLTYGLDIEFHPHVWLWIGLPIFTFFVLASVVATGLRGLLRPTKTGIN